MLSNYCTQTHTLKLVHWRSPRSNHHPTVPITGPMLSHVKHGDRTTRTQHWYYIQTPLCVARLWTLSFMFFFSSWIFLMSHKDITLRWSSWAQKPCPPSVLSYSLFETKELLEAQDKIWLIFNYESYKAAVRESENKPVEEDVSTKWNHISFGAPVCLWSLYTCVCVMHTRLLFPLWIWMFTLRNLWGADDTVRQAEDPPTSSFLSFCQHVNDVLVLKETEQ